MVIINTHQSVPETNYICFTPNTTRSPAHISVDGNNMYKFMDSQKYSNCLVLNCIYLCKILISLHFTWIIKNRTNCTMEWFSISIISKTINLFVLIYNWDQCSICCISQDLCNNIIINEFCNYNTKIFILCHYGQHHIS